MVRDNTKNNTDGPAPRTPSTAGPVRQIDVARRAGVARPTVSRVLGNVSDRFSVRPEVRARVLQAAEELGYRPNVMARALRRTSSGIVGWLGSMYPLPFTAELLDALGRTLSPAGFLVAPSFMVRDQEMLELPWWRIDAAVVSGNRTEKALKKIEQSGIPYVCVNSRVGASGAVVEFDDVAGMTLACEHLLSLGHRTLAFAILDIDQMWDHPSVRTRVTAYEQVLKAAGRTPLPALHFQASEDAEAAVDAALAQGATAFICYNARCTTMLQGILMRRNLQIPRDVSLICFNDDDIIANLTPGMTTIRLSGSQAGITAATMLLEWFRHPEKKPSRVVLPEELVIRGSTAVPRPCHR